MTENIDTKIHKYYINLLNKHVEKPETLYIPILLSVINGVPKKIFDRLILLLKTYHKLYSNISTDNKSQYYSVENKVRTNNEQLLYVLDDVHTDYNLGELLDHETKELNFRKNIMIIMNERKKGLQECIKKIKPDESSALKKFFDDEIQKLTVIESKEYENEEDKIVDICNSIKWDNLPNDKDCDEKKNRIK